MKTKISLLALVVVFTSCDLILVEPAFNDRDRIIGLYQVDEQSQTYNDYTRFQVQIRRGGYDDGIIIENFYDAGLRVRTTVIYDKIYMDRQLVDGYEIEGVGTIYRDEILFSYRVRDTFSSRTTTDFCSATAWLF